MKPVTKKHENSKDCDAGWLKLTSYGKLRKYITDLFSDVANNACAGGEHAGEGEDDGEIRTSQEDAADSSKAASAAGLEPDVVGVLLAALSTNPRLPAKIDAFVKKHPLKHCDEAPLTVPLAKILKRTHPVLNQYVSCLWSACIEGALEKLGKDSAPLSAEAKMKEILTVIANTLWDDAHTEHRDLMDFLRDMFSTIAETSLEQLSVIDLNLAQIVTSVGDKSSFEKLVKLRSYYVVCLLMEINEIELAFEDKWQPIGSIIFKIIDCISMSLDHVCAVDSTIVDKGEWEDAWAAMLGKALALADHKFTPKTEAEWLRFSRTEKVRLERLKVCQLKTLYKEAYPDSSEEKHAGMKRDELLTELVAHKTESEKTKEGALQKAWEQQVENMQDSLTKICSGDADVLSTIQHALGDTSTRIDIGGVNYNVFPQLLHDFQKLPGCKALTTSALLTHAILSNHKDEGTNLIIYKHPKPDDDSISPKVATKIYIKCDRVPAADSLRLCLSGQVVATAVDPDAPSPSLPEGIIPFELMRESIGDTTYVYTVRPFQDMLATSSGITVPAWFVRPLKSTSGSFAAPSLLLEPVEKVC